MNNDDWESKYWANRQQQLNQQKQQQTPQNINNSWREINVNQAIQQKLMCQMTEPAQQSKMVFLREGYDHYTAVEGASGFGATIPMVKSLGKLQSNIQGRQFVIKGEVSAYCIDNLPSVDLSKINEHPERKLTLVRVAENMFSREILVPRSAIVEANKVFNGKQLLHG